MTKSFFIHVILPVMFLFSFIINVSGDGRGYYKAWGIILIGILWVYRSEQKEIVRNISPIITCAVVSTTIMTLLAYLLPQINKGLNSILPNHFIAHIVILFVAYNVWTFDKEIFERVVKITGIIIFLTAIFGLVVWFLAHVSLETSICGYHIYDASYRLNAVYLNPIPAGSVFLVGFWVSTIYKTRWFAILQRVLYCVVILFTQSRSTWIGLLFSLLLLVVLNRKEYSKQYKELGLIQRIVVVAIVLMVFIAVILFVLKFMSYRIVGMFSGQAYNVRSSYWRYVWALFRQEDLLWELFGHGYGSSSSMMLNSPVYHEPYAIIDNGLLTVLYENGAVCLFALFVVFYRAWRSIKRINKIGSIEWICGMVIIALIIPSCFYEIQGWYSPILLVFWCMAPFLYKSERNNEKSNI